MSTKNIERLTNESDKKFNHFHPGNLMEEDNIFMCEYMTGLPTLAKVKDGDTELDIQVDVLESLYE